MSGCLFILVRVSHTLASGARLLVLAGEGEKQKINKKRQRGVTLYTAWRPAAPPLHPCTQARRTNSVTQRKGCQLYRQADAPPRMLLGVHMTQARAAAVRSAPDVPTSFPGKTCRGWLALNNAIAAALPSRPGNSNAKKLAGLAQACGTAAEYKAREHGFALVETR